MTPPSNESLDIMYKAMKEANDKDHKMLFNKVDWIEDKIDTLIEKLEDKFVMRKEFKVAIWLLWAFATALWIIWFFIK